MNLEELGVVSPLAKWKKPDQCGHLSGILQRVSTGTSQNSPGRYDLSCPPTCSHRKGVPIEIYVFVNDTRWVEYEGIQSDIFDHLLASLPVFGLRAFQLPSDFSVTKAISS